MTGTIVLGPIGLSYLSEVGASLADLDPAERGELLDEVQEHLLAISAEVEVTGDVLTARLGPPARYAAELRTAAGFEPVGRSPRTVPPLSAGAMWQATKDAHLGAAAWAYLRRLVPAWWAVRAFLAGGALVAVTEQVPGRYDHGSIMFLGWRPDVIQYAENLDGKLWLILPLFLGIVVSVAVGLRAEAHGNANRPVNRLLDVAGVLGLVLFPMWWVGPAFHMYVLG